MSTVGRRNGQRSRGVRGASGQTLIELLVVLSMLLLVLLLPMMSLLHGLDVPGARSQAQICQGAGALAQVRAAYLGRLVSVDADASRIRVVDDLGNLTLNAPSSGLPLSTNLSRWRTPDGFSVSFGPGSASPTGAGSVYFGGPGWGSRVVIHAESGIMRRERQ